MQYDIAKSVDGECSAAFERVIAAWKDGRFGVLTEFDVRATMKKKINVDFRDYRIMGAATPRLRIRRCLRTVRPGPCCGVMLSFRIWEGRRSRLQP